MIFDVKGQTYQFGGKTFVVGGSVLELRNEFPGPLGTILSINAEDEAHPAAQCGYEDWDPECLPLERLVPVSSAVPENAGRQYALHFYFDGSDGQKVDVLGVSSDKSVLVRLMLDDVKNDESISAVMTYSEEDTEEDALYFDYESGEDVTDPFYLGYVIKPVLIYPDYGGEKSVGLSDE